MNNTEINFNVKQADLTEQFAQELASGMPVLVGFHTNENTLRNNIPFITMRVFQNANPKSVDPEFTGIGLRIRSCTQNISVPIAEAKGILKNGEVQLGYVFPNKNIEEKHELAPAYEGQKPREYGFGDIKGKLILYKGQPTYKHTSLVNGDAEDLIREGDPIETTSTSIADAVAANTNSN